VVVGRLGFRNRVAAPRRRRRRGGHALVLVDIFSNGRIRLLSFRDSRTIIVVGRRRRRRHGQVGFLQVLLVLGVRELGGGFEATISDDEE
jgi:hypothetical protein